MGLVKEEAPAVAARVDAAAEEEISEEEMAELEEALAALKQREMGG
jgi:RNA processing factor Prp31